MHKRLVVVIAGVSLCCEAQWLNYPEGRTPRTKDGKPNLSAPAPKALNGKPEFSGVWTVDPTPLSEIERMSPHFGDIQIDLRETSKYLLNLLWDFKPEEQPITPAGAARMKQRARRDSCLPAGIPYAMLLFPFKMVQSPHEIVMFFEHQEPPRQIHLDGRPLPKDPEPAWMGYSSAKWQGDTLVVDSAGFKDGAALDMAGHPRGESTRMTERFRRRDFGHLDYEIRVEDPQWYTRPFTVKTAFNLLPDTDVMEYVCNENEKDRAHLPN